MVKLLCLLALLYGDGLAFESSVYGIRNAENEIRATMRRGDSLFVFSRLGPRIYDTNGTSRPTHLSDSHSWILSQTISVAGISGQPLWVLTQELNGTANWRLFQWSPGRAP